MQKLPDCNRCLNYSHSEYLVCAIHPSGCDRDTCPDFKADEAQKPDELWVPPGYIYINDRLVKQSVSYEQDFQPRLSRAQQFEVLMTHPIFTGVCPHCRTSYPQNIKRMHWDCEACGWIDDSI